MNTQYIYADASFDKITGIAILGMAIFKSTLEHESFSVQESELIISEIKEKNNIRAEIKAVLSAFDYCLQNTNKFSNRIIYSDCMSVHNLPGRRRGLELQSYMSKSKGKVLTNADLYQDFYKKYEELNPQLIWLKGHRSKEKMISIPEKHFSDLDKLVRKKLRETRKR